MLNDCIIFAGRCQHFINKNSADLLSSNYYCVILLRLYLAPIAQQVERIHGKDEVSGSNPDGGSSYKTLRISDLQGLLFSQIYITRTPAANEARQAPMATTIRDFSKKPRIRATPKPITAAMKEPVEYRIAGNVIADRTVYGM